MPKAKLPPLPLSALFAINKPSGPSSMSVIDDIKSLLATSRLFVDSADLVTGDKGKGKDTGKGRRKGRRGRSGAVKVGQGGTLDPLADGVLVVGVSRGTKKLSEFLDCVKEYKTTALLGCETDSYDSEGAQVRSAPWKSVTRENVEAALPRFRGSILQTPPIFSALKMDGMPLYDYARKGIPLPRPIEKRPVTVHSLSLVEWIGTNHMWRWPEKKFTEEDRLKLENALAGAERRKEKESVHVNATPAETKTEKEKLIEDGTIPEPVPNPSAVDSASTFTHTNPANDSAEPTASQVEEDTEHSPAFVLSMTVSGGTYVRSIVHDLGHAVGSAAHVVTLTRVRQGRFTLELAFDPQGELEADVPGPDVDADLVPDRGCVPWDVIARAKEDPGERDEEGWCEWERAVMKVMEIVE
ncbi:pseudouridine synthase [Rickenella mellea]|uniref:tRNA pseudouridine(55) synthase n=1 Tax=Rickenella mellea TaxID=50990 RepID=A0A4Y7Q3V7_9AGAM|nr:pseudouridine synthase [Rickenella mellea]